MSGACVAGGDQSAAGAERFAGSAVNVPRGAPWEVGGSHGSSQEKVENNLPNLMELMIDNSS